MTTKEINWGTKARYLTKTDICKGVPKRGKKQDFRGWVIEFFGENTRAGIAFERVAAEMAGISADWLESWSDDATIEVQVEIFNESLKKLKIIKQKGRRNGKSTSKRS